MSTGVFFTAPGPVAGLPSLPGDTIEAIHAFRTGSGKRVASVESNDVGSLPVMVGEFADADGAAYAMIVNLSLETSVRAVPVPKKAHTLEQASAENRSWSPVDLENGLWLVAGQGVLLRVR